MLEGMPGVSIALPHVLGSDASGTVDAVGAGVEDLSPGDPVLLNPGIWDGSCPACLDGHEERCREYRILGEHTQGALTEFVVLPRRNLYHKPASLSFAQAAAAPLVLQTAWRALLTAGELRAGETLAVVGAGGGLAPAAIQVGKLCGARVVVLSRSETKLAAARGLGADDTLVLPADGTHDRLLWQWSGKRGIDVIFDSVGEATLGRSVRALARGGRVVVVGATTGPNVQLDLRTLFWRQASIRGSTMANRAEFEAMFRALEQGRLRPTIDREFGFEDARAAFARCLEPDVFGKVVVQVSG